MKNQVKDFNFDNFSIYSQKFGYLSQCVKSPFSWQRFKISFFSGFADSIVLLDLQIPPFVKEGATVKLVCVYDLEFDGLYSVKWYKNDIEFYSYIPKMGEKTKKRFFDLPGVHINVSFSSLHLESKSLNLLAATHLLPAEFVRYTKQSTKYRIQVKIHVDQNWPKMIKLVQIKQDLTKATII